MNKFYKFCILSIVLLISLVSCQKELSRELGTVQGSAKGTLLDSLGNCQSAIIKGTYLMDSVLTDSNYVLIRVNFTSAGKYKISTDTPNGMWFRDSGFVLTPGTAVVKLKGNGKPILPSSTNFVVSFDSTYCGFTIGTEAEKDYLITSTGSFWSFQYNPHLTGPTGNFIDSILVTVAAPTIPYNGKLYSQYATSQKDTFYFAKGDSNIYYEFGTIDFDYTGIFDSLGTGNFIEYAYLKANQPVGTSWETAETKVKFGGYNGGVSKTGSTKAVFTIMNTGSDYTIAGQTLHNTITVKREIMFREIGTTSYVKAVEGLAVYAKGVGLVDQSINLSGVLVQNIPAQRWRIY
ncbi:MAG: hypothetical protein K2Q21_02250 [Chitinophagaceae bacterium]|nr:hypothetical protein [Chitinophagaceae bacterium]